MTDAETERHDGPVDDAWRRIHGGLAHTWRVSVASLRHRRAGAVGLVTGLAYLVTYLWVVGHIVPGAGDLSLVVVNDPISRAFGQTALATFEPVARLTLGPIAWLIAPINVLIGLLLGLLVAANLAVVVFARAQPAACEAPSSRVGAIAGLPALLSGAACCGPTVLFALGVAGAGAFVGPIAALLPVSALLLVAGLVLASRSVTVGAARGARDKAPSVLDPVVTDDDAVDATSPDRATASDPETAAVALASDALGVEPAAVASAPGRVNLVGGHTDYNDGFVLPVAVDRRVAAAGRRRDDDVVRVHARETGETVAVAGDVAREDLPAEWVAYVVGTLRELDLAGDDVDSGFDIAVAGDVPIGAGLSSSAALAVAVAGLANHLDGGGRDPATLADAAHRAETGFVGLDCGIMDQYAAAFGDPSGALFLDCRSREHEVVPFDADRLGLVVADSGVSHDLADSAYDDRVAECRSAVEYLRRLLDDSGIDALRDVSPAAFERVAEDLPSPERERARHVVAENERVRRARDALAGGDDERVGETLFDSHASLRDDYAVSCTELDELVELAREGGALGARMTGGGFGGSVVCLCERGALDDVVGLIETRYPERTGVDPDVYAVRPTGGVRSRSP